MMSKIDKVLAIMDILHCLQHPTKLNNTGKDSFPTRSLKKACKPDNIFQEEKSHLSGLPDETLSFTPLRRYMRGWGPR